MLQEARRQEFSKVGSLEQKARKAAYHRVVEEGLRRFSQNEDKVKLRYANMFGGQYGELEIPAPTKMILRTGVEWDELQTIEVPIQSLADGNVGEWVHYAFKNGALIKRTDLKAVEGFAVKKRTIEFSTGFENVYSQEADSLADFIKDPTKENYKAFVVNMVTLGERRYYSTVQNQVRAGQRRYDRREAAEK